MPTYEYACKQCGEHLEVVQKFSDDALTDCPSCSGSLRKVFSSIGISFKGSGFYKNDSRIAGSAKAKEPAASDSGSSGGGDSGAPKADAPAKGDGAKGEGTKSDTKSAKGDKAKSDKGSSTAAAS